MLEEQAWIALIVLCGMILGGLALIRQADKYPLG
jgi:hypothetical protein